MTSQGDTPIPKLSTQEEADALFGTHLEVDSLDSGPKFLCQYVGPPSTQLGGDLSKQSKYQNDSIFIRKNSFKTHYCRMIMTPKKITKLCLLR